jgi:hypothetical protein
MSKRRKLNVQIAAGDNIDRRRIKSKEKDHSPLKILYSSNCQNSNYSNLQPSKAHSPAKVHFDKLVEQPAQREVRQGIQELQIESPAKRLSKVTERSHEHHSNEKTMLRSSSANARMNDSSKLLSDEKMNYTLLVDHDDPQEISEMAVLGTPRVESEESGGWTLS